jgi:hypothetical protein
MESRQSEFFVTGLPSTTSPLEPPAGLDQQEGLPRTNVDQPGTSRGRGRRSKEGA